MSGILFDKKYQVMPDMPPAQFEALKADILERGILTPIDVDEDGRILDGHHRYRACIELGIKDFPTILRPGLAEGDKRLFARKSNMMRRHLNRKQIRELIVAQLKETPDWANNRIGGELGVDKNTVRAVRLALEATCEIPKLTDLKGKDERVRGERRKPALFATSPEELRKLITGIQEGTIDPSEYNGFQKLTGDIFGEEEIWAEWTEQQRKEARLFPRFLIEKCSAGEGVEDHCGWLSRHDFPPDVWLGEEGRRWRAQYGMTKGWKELSSKKFLASWEAFKKEHLDDEPIWRPVHEAVV